MEEMSINEVMTAMGSAIDGLNDADGRARLETLYGLLEHRISDARAGLERTTKALKSCLEKQA